MTRTSNRDDFSRATRNKLARQAVYQCNNPSCRQGTWALTSDGAKEIDIGVAAHICAAAPNPPARRYRADQTPEQRKSIENGIWLCQDCAKLIDSDDPAFSEDVLHDWKRKHNDYLWNCVRHKLPFGSTLPPTISELGARLQRAAAEDLDVFRRSPKWPKSSVGLRLEVKGQSEPVLTDALGGTLGASDDFVIVAPPGTGKTSALLQVAEAAVAASSGTPLVVSLSDWSNGGRSLIEEILRRPAFSDFTEANLRSVAEQPGVVFMFDSWNELGVNERRRARTEIQNLRAELPAATFVVTTRPEASDVPIDGTLLTVLELSEQQQLDIAREIKGDQGARLVDEAWRTPGVRELITTPLYLTSLLALPDGEPFPQTKEEILRRFVEAHQRQPDHAEPLMEVTCGLPEVFLSDLAVSATVASNTSISVADARRSVARTDDFLVDDGQITIRPQPNAVLDAFVNHHLLVRTREPESYRFQHQQFQEWYASQEVERLMLESNDDATALAQLKTEILNVRSWEEAILFAVERIARGDERQQTACGNAILAALEVDPILAAEMIFRSTDEVWYRISEPVQLFVRRWHTPEKLDRSLRFMLTSGRPEFRDLVWPFVTHENNQISLPALRSAKRFRTSVLGPNAEEEILALPLEQRETLLSEIVHNSGMDGLDLVASITKSDPEAEVKISVIQSLSFRMADSHVADVISTVDDDTFDLMYERGYLDEIDDTGIQERLAAARARVEERISPAERLQRILYVHDGGDHSAEISEFVATIDLGDNQDAHVGLIYEAHKQYSNAVSQGLLQRLLTGRTLFHGADDILAKSGVIVEDDELLAEILSVRERGNNRSEAAASVLGSVTVGKLIDALFGILDEINALSSYDEVLSTRYHSIREHIAHVPGSSLVTAILERSASASNEHVQELAELLVRRDTDGPRGRPILDELHSSIEDLATQWAVRLIADGDGAKRRQLSAVADLIGKFPSESLLPVLNRLHDDELRRYRAIRQQTLAERRRGAAANEADMYYLSSYERAFAAIKSTSTTTLMMTLLLDEFVGEHAAAVLTQQWIQENEPKKDRRFPMGVDFSRVEDMRQRRADNPADTCVEAEAIFEAVASLIGEDATEEQKKLAIKLAIRAVRLPHGERNEIIEKLLELTPQRSRADLVRNLVLSGETIPFAVVHGGIEEVLEAAKAQPWILDEGWQLKAWVELLPFTDRPDKLPEVIASLPQRQRDPFFLEGMLSACNSIHTVEMEDVVFKLAENDENFYNTRVWHEAIGRCGTASSVRRYLDLILEDKIDPNGRWYTTRTISELLKEHPEVREYVKDILKAGESPKIVFLAQIMVECADAETLLLLVELENRLERGFLSSRSVESVVVEHVPSAEWQNAFEAVPVPAIELRQTLLEMTTDGGPSDAAARILRIIDKNRDQNGAPEEEPRHPDLASGKPWPILETETAAS